MEELKSCIFCGKPVDRDYSYCPWCGYEFGPGDDVPVVRREPASAAAVPADDPVGESAPVPAETPGPARTCSSGSPRLEELLSDMERELDLILRTSSADP